MRYTGHTAAVAIAALLFIAPASRLHAASLRTSVFTGFDSFIDRYTILDVDTLETIHEFRAGFLAGVTIGRADTRATLRNRFSWGNQTLDETLDGDLAFRAGENTWIELRGSMHLKAFREESDYTFGNDYVQSNGRLRIKRRLAPDLSAAWKTRVELVDYDRRTDFDYDYRYVDTGLEIEGGSYFEKYLRASASIGAREAPDTTALSYRRLVGDVEGQLAAGETAVHLFAHADRRDYDDGARSDYWLVDSFAEVRLADGAAAWSFRVESELVSYDRPDATFFDTHFLRGGFRLRTPLAGGAANAYAEPRYGMMRCPDYAEERYGEGSIVLGIDVARGADLWFSASWEPGYRGYGESGNTLYSDFSFNRLSLMGGAGLGAGIDLSLFVSHDPERHSRREDDFSITLVSLEISRSF
ncbi:MAG: hypothetical protein JW876_11200 [Candidatus Krumholzibacteriota bacterium]|nr:hypothetical protein [Candidatus Krumholzibacteriota bacterium]